MPFNSQGGTNGGLPPSPGGHEFGIQGWSWPEPVPRAITFFVNNTVMVTDQFGRAIRGAEIEGRRVYFAIRPPQADDASPDVAQVPALSGNGSVQVKLATHAEAITALESERVDWVKLTRAGWPQLPYEQLKKLPSLPPWPFDEKHAPSSNRACNCVVCAIRDKTIRRDALTMRAEAAAVTRKEMEDAQSESHLADEPVVLPPQVTT